MKISPMSGAAMAAAAAALFATATVSTTPAQADSGKVKCFGLNACKGNGSCKTLANACKGHNACKGQGMSMMSKAKCIAKGGSTTRS